MAINNFKPFALDPNANVTSQADWEVLPALLSGFTAGKASSAQVNKAIRQASFIAAALAQYTANKSGLDVLDDGDLNGFISKMGTAFGKDFQALDATLSALAGLATGANKLPYFTGNDTAAQTDLTSVGRDIIGKNTIADILTYLRLEKFQQADDATRIFSPDGDVYLRIDNAGWYFARKNAGKIPVSIDAGGTGATNAKDAVFNLGLGAGTPAIGIPFFWPLAAMPNTVMDEWSDMVFLKPNGASFSAATYPKLAKVWPGLVIPDMRGEFPRIWDDGRGVDSGRALLSYQGDASRNITGSFGGTTNNDTCSVLGQGAGVFANGTSLVTPTNGSVIGSATRPVTMTLDISRQVPTASEFRPRNFALNFLIRAK
ncbi:phage tail protein [Escherichia coli]